MCASRLLAAFLTMLALSPPAGAAATEPTSETQVLALDDYFLPSFATVPRGETVVWDFSDAERSHTATDSSGMGLFDSGLVSPGGPSFAYTFGAAGSYPYTCTIHTDDMNGRVNVPVRVWPESGQLGRTFRVRWATGAAPDGFVYDVQLKRNDGSWSPWSSGTTAAKAEFEPARHGTYRFRAKLRRESGGASDWSESTSLMVT